MLGLYGKICGPCLQTLKSVSLPCTAIATAQQVRHHNKHWKPEFKKLRAQKVIKVELPDFHEKEKSFEELSPDEMRLWYKKKGLQPHRPWNEKEMMVTATSGIFEPYIPPEGDGKVSALSTAGAKQNIEWLKKKGTSWKHLRKIRKLEEDFELYPDFVDIAHDTYIKAHEAMANKDTTQLIKYASERAYPEMIHNTQLNTIHWRFIKSIEPPRVVHVRTTHVVQDTNLFGQITVRFNTQQSLAIYDRFGRLTMGSEILAKDVLEYVVFEKHIVNQYGAWRVHAKIIPDWLPKPAPLPRTYLKDPQKDEVSQSEASPDYLKIPEIKMPRVL